jgi:hypothetical protein
VSHGLKYRKFETRFLGAKKAKMERNLLFLR